MVEAAKAIQISHPYVIISIHMDATHEIIMQVKQEHAEAIASTAEKIMYGGAGGSLLFGLTAQEMGIYVGIVVAVAGFLVNWYYKYKAFQLEKQIHAKRMKDNS